MACIRGVQSLTPPRSFGSAPFAASLRSSAVSPARAGAIRGDSSCRAAKQASNQKKNTTNLFMARIWIASYGMSSALCYKEKTAPDLQIDQHAFAFAHQPILGVAATDEVHGDGLLTR